MAITVQGGKHMSELQPALGAAGASHYYFRYDWARAVTIESDHPSPAWSVHTASGPAPSLLHSHSGNHMVLTRPAAPEGVDVSDGQQTVTVWFVAATLHANRTGRVNLAANPAWPEFQHRLQERYGAPTYDFVRLGPVQFHSAGQSLEDLFDGTRYGDEIELVGEVLPASIQTRVNVPFYILRRILGGFINGLDASGHPLPDNRGPRSSVSARNDTSRQSGVLNSLGQLFDYDLPGSVMTGANVVGDQHTYDVQFEQMVVIGAVTLGNPWPITASMGLGVSDALQWRTTMHVRCTRAATVSDGSVGIEMT